jgi:hypothetical protein
MDMAAARRSGRFDRPRDIPAARGRARIKVLRAAFYVSCSANRYFFERKYRVTLSRCNRSSIGEMTLMQWMSTRENTLYFIIAINVTLLQQARCCSNHQMQFGGRSH